MVENYNLFDCCQNAQKRELVARPNPSMDDNLHSLPRRLIELRMEHADLDNLIDRALFDLASDDLTLRRLKKRRLRLRDQITRIESELEPQQPA
jgi:hypothetical protein